MDAQNDDLQDRKNARIMIIADRVKNGGLKGLDLQRELEQAANTFWTTVPTIAGEVRAHLRSQPDFEEGHLAPLKALSAPPASIMV